MSCARRLYCFLAATAEAQRTSDDTSGAAAPVSNRVMNDPVELILQEVPDEIRDELRAQIDEARSRGAGEVEQRLLDTVRQARDRFKQAAAAVEKRMAE